MNDYELKVLKDVDRWQRLILQGPSSLNHHIKNLNEKFNTLIPDNIHKALTSMHKHLCRAVIFGSKITTEKWRFEGNLQLREAAVRKKIIFYAVAAAAEGGITGVGGIFLGLVDFPLLVGIQIKLLFEMASIYGFRTSDYKERFFLLYVFLLSFSSHEKRREVFLKIKNWNNFSNQLPDDIHELDWRTFQEEYRDYTEIVKLPQFIPIIGAPFGAVINFQLTSKLGKDAMNAYRMRWNKLM